ncbi:MAG: hypothetical protein ACJAZP_002312 [Psychromonas sp.]|jgi:hypothetical protein
MVDFLSFNWITKMKESCAVSAHLLIKINPDMHSNNVISTAIIALQATCFYSFYGAIIRLLNLVFSHTIPNINHLNYQEQCNAG